MNIFTLFVSITILSLASCGPTPSSHMKIIGGTDVTSGDPLFRRVGGLFDQSGKLQCSVSALKSDVFVTAGHCVANRTVQHWTIQFNKDQNSQESMEVLSAIPHPDFSFTNIFTLDPDHAPNDIALVNTTTKSQVAVTTALYDIQAKTDHESQLNLMLAGLGRTLGSDPNSKGILHKASVSVAHIRHDVHEATSENNSGIMACFGDSGGPAFYINNTTIQLRGVISRGDSGCLKGITVITDATAFKDFLNSH
jgi:secreted trypsin-like serine protease